MYSELDYMQRKTNYKYINFYYKVYTNIWLLSRFSGKQFQQFTNNNSVISTSNKIHRIFLRVGTFIVEARVKSISLYRSNPNLVRLFKIVPRY